MDNSEKLPTKALERASILSEVDESRSDDGTLEVRKLDTHDHAVLAGKFAELEPLQAVDFISEMLFELRRCAAAQNLSHLAYFIEMAIQETREIQKQTMLPGETKTKTG